MPTVPAAHFGAAPSVDEEFLELVHADEQLLRAEFDEIVTREWPTGHPPARPTAATPGTNRPRPRRRLGPRGIRASRRQRRHRGASRWRRQRSPPRLTPAGVYQRPNEGSERRQVIARHPARITERSCLLVSRLGRVRATAPDASRATPTPDGVPVRGPGESNAHHPPRHPMAAGRPTATGPEHQGRRSRRSHDR